VRDESIENYNTWNDEFTFFTREQLLNHAHSVGQPAIDYYNKLFNSEGGDCYNVRQMTNATKIFNPMFLAGKSEAEVVTVLHPLADKLIHFVMYTLQKISLHNLRRRLKRLFMKLIKSTTWIESSHQSYSKQEWNKELKGKKLTEIQYWIGSWMMASIPVVSGNGGDLK